jgi:hypothetical protein
VRAPLGSVKRDSRKVFRTVAPRAQTGDHLQNDFRDAEAIAEAVQRPTMKFVATKTADQLDLQALHRVRERLVSQRTDMINHSHGGQTVACSCRQIRASCWSGASGVGGA